MFGKINDNRKNILLQFKSSLNTVLVIPSELVSQAFNQKTGRLTKTENKAILPMAMFDFLKERYL